MEEKESSVLIPSETEAKKSEAIMLIAEMIKKHSQYVDFGK
ncbi:hypothetical protein BN1058_00122 [Paraliobacillus sp. PM-2]|nr:hypothetical protein [Paraliobacillus sp. PM-2]CQR45882.1 hypothetical protein BN1058_00122 [Paraliobacillus sp. PM-2]